MTRRHRDAAAIPTIVRKRRCAVYTRVSTDDQTSQDYNSLHAQRDASEAFIPSQRAEGWVLLPDHYDDSGISGATLERPALQRLLRDIEAGRIDIVVCYKIDRLNRSLMDFSRLIEVFDANSVTFVSVTQSFNTTTSMGRLTLNILLSFAQFDREVIGERVRDKIAASRARGIWMGGPVPLGYRVEYRKLLVDEPTAATVHRVFEGFVETKSATRLIPILQAEGHVTKTGRAFDKGSSARLLANPVYVGEALHKGQSFPGEHDAIVTRDLWNRVQAVMQEGPRSRGDPALVKALARAFRWRRMLETGAASLVSDIARQEKLNTSYVSRVLRLTLSTPGHIEAIPDGRQRPEMTLRRVMEPFPVEWTAQRLMGQEVVA